MILRVCKIVPSERSTRRYRYTMIHDIWNMRVGLDPKILVEIVANIKFPLIIDSSARYIPLVYSDWSKVPDDKKNVAWQVILVTKKTVYFIVILLLLKIIMLLFLYILFQEQFHFQQRERDTKLCVCVTLITCGRF